MNTQVFAPAGARACFTESGDRLLCASAVARRIGRTPRMIRYLAERKQIPALKRGKLWFFRQTDVDRYCRSREGCDVWDI
jgi:hypothetical protein